MSGARRKGWTATDVAQACASLISPAAGALLLVRLATGLAGSLLFWPLLPLAIMCATQDLVVAARWPTALLPRLAGEDPSSPPTPARIFSGVRLCLAILLCLRVAPDQRPALELAVWSMSTALVKGSAKAPTRLYFGPSYVRYAIRAVTRQSLGHELSSRARGAVWGTVWVVALLGAAGSLASSGPYAPTRARIHAAIADRGLPNLSRVPAEHNDIPAGGEPEVPTDAPSKSGVSSTTEPWSCPTTSLRSTTPTATELMDAAWKRRGSLAVGCPTGEAAVTSSGAIVVYLGGGRESDPAAVIGSPAQDVASVVLSPHTAVVRRLVADDLLVAAFPVMATQANTITVFVTNDGCITSVATYGAAAEHFVVPAIGTALLARALTVLGARAESVTAASRGWRVTARLADERTTEFVIEQEGKTYRIVRGPKDVKGLSNSNNRCERATVRQSLAAPR